MTLSRTGNASFDEAAVAILGILADGHWHKSIDEIHKPLRPWVQEHMFGKVKSHFHIEHRKVGGGRGSYVEWRSPNPARDKMLRHLLDEGVGLRAAEMMASHYAIAMGDTNGDETIDFESFRETRTGPDRPRAPLSTRITRDGEPLSLRWGQFHIAAMIYAVSWDSGEGPFEMNEPPKYLVRPSDGDEMPLNYPEEPCPISPPEAFHIVRDSVIAATALNDRPYTLKKEHRFIDVTDGEVLHLLPGDVLEATREPSGSDELFRLSEAVGRSLFRRFVRGPATR